MAGRLGRGGRHTASPILDTPTAIARRLNAAIEAGKHGPELAAFFTEDARTLEHPNSIKPRGARVELEAMLAASSAGAGLLSRQSYDVLIDTRAGRVASIETFDCYEPFA